MKTFAPVNLGVVLLRLAAQLSVTFTHNWTGLGSSALRPAQYHATSYIGNYDSAFRFARHLSAIGGMLQIGGVPVILNLVSQPIYASVFVGFFNIPAKFGCQKLPRWLPRILLASSSYDSDHLMSDALFRTTQRANP